LFWDMVNSGSCQLSAFSSQLTLVLMILGGVSPLIHCNAEKGIFVTPRREVPVAAGLSLAGQPRAGVPTRTQS